MFLSTMKDTKKKYTTPNGRACKNNYLEQYLSYGDYMFLNKL